MDSNGTATMSRYARTPLHASSLTQNALVQHDYHTMPIGGRNTIPNYAGHIPGAQAVFAQRRALASFHAVRGADRGERPCAVCLSTLLVA